MSLLTKMKFYTLGVYNSTENEFFNKLTKNKIDTFCDIRQLRGVRGSKYLFANSNRLQKKLEELEIKYFHVLTLAPTSEMRKLQKESDVKKGEGQRKRTELGQEFKSEYKAKILKKFNFELFFRQLENEDAKHVVLFCVEESAEACHRSIVAETLKEKFNLPVTHL
jgi:uncharacterized protein (DUF488 family)